MNRAAFALLALLLPAPALAAATPDASVTRINAAPIREGWFVCDGIDGPAALFAGKPDGKGISLMTLLDRRTGRFDTQSYQVGPADPGAGQINWSLSQGGKAVGSVHGVNPGMIDDGGATVPTIVGMQLGDTQLDCRWLAHTRFIGLDSRRTVVVTETPQGLVYQAFSFKGRGPVTNPDGVQRSNKPTLRLLGGSEIVGDRPGFRFANGGYVYFVQRPTGGEAATLTITHGGRMIGLEKFVGFTYAPPLGRAPEKLTAGLGPDAVWPGQGVDACRKPDTAKPEATKPDGRAVDACLIDLMKKGGASAAAIAFSQRLIATDDPGFVSGWKQAGPVGIASVTYPFRANTTSGTWLVPASGDPIDVDAYQLSADDKARPDYKAMLSDSPDAFPVPPGEIAIGRSPAGNLRISVTTPTAVCHSCAAGASIVVGYDFDASGHFLSAGIVAVA